SAKCFNAIAADITINVLLSSRIQNIHEFSSRSSILVLQMPRHLSTFSACLLVSFFLMTWHWCCMAGETNKAGPIYPFCGDDFKTAWETCCGGQCRNRKRTTGLTMSFQRARSFLMSPSGLESRKRSILNGVEECCYEKCSLEEISEYNC
ncbi:unnamed protein product, partial [Pocillopora meandrina]